MIDHWQTRDRLETHRRRFEKSIPVGLFLTDIPFLHCRVFLTVAHIRASLIISSRNRISLVFLSFRDVHRREIKKKEEEKEKRKKKRGERRNRGSPRHFSLRPRRKAMRPLCMSFRRVSLSLPLPRMLR